MTSGNKALSGNLVGLVGWRGMVGSVLMDRMAAEGDFDLIEPLFFSTSNAGGKAPIWAKNETVLQDAYDIDALKRCDAIVTAQGGDYTSSVFAKLRATGWQGHWIDAASTLRMEDSAVITLDPVNMNVIRDALIRGGKNWVGGNCTVSCMLMGVGVAGLFMETHPDPKNAMSDGPNAVPLHQMRPLLETLLALDQATKRHGFLENNFE